MGVCNRLEARGRIFEGWLFIPRAQRQTAEGAESSSGRGHCSRGQSTPAQCQSYHQYARLVERLALAMLVSISEGFCLEGLLGAIFFNESDMLAADVELVVSVEEVHLLRMILAISIKRGHKRRR